MSSMSMLERKAKGGLRVRVDHEGRRGLQTDGWTNG